MEVTDLGQAIFQVALYITYLYDEPTAEQAEFARKRMCYWKDVWLKLNKLKAKEEQQDVKN